MKKDGWDGNENEDKIQWTFSGALFYSIIVITTIGEFENYYLFIILNKNHNTKYHHNTKKEQIKSLLREYNRNTKSH